ncbi:hypothetical protein ABIE45_006251 [Methylobacterium sp. OAE515]|uniref:hypothetical protein n=1 Tax=Methylobacterium sp. OAE515 TaxID=2817895 RepID=UPI00178A8514
MHPSNSALRFLVAESGPLEAREEGRESIGRCSGESYVETLVCPKWLYGVDAPHL